MSKLRLHLPPAPDAADPEVGRVISALKETRGRTLQALKNIPDEVIDRERPGGGDTIGTILYHLAIIEADWLYDDILNTQDADWPKELFPSDVRADGVNLTPFSGETLAQHTERLDKVRDLLLGVISPMSFDDFHEIRERKDYDLSAAWVCHHLMQHEAEHRAHIHP